jgi:hypothetical protein
MWSLMHKIDLKRTTPNTPKLEVLEKQRSALMSFSGMGENPSPLGKTSMQIYRTTSHTKI